MYSLSQMNQWCADNAPLTKPKLKQLFAHSCGYCRALRDAGMTGGDPLLNDASIVQREIARIGREMFNMKLEAVDKSPFSVIPGAWREKDESN